MEREHKCQNEKDVTIHFERRFSRSTLLSGFGARTWTILSLRKERRKFSIIYNKHGKVGEKWNTPFLSVISNLKFHSQSPYGDRSTLAEEAEHNFPRNWPCTAIILFVLYEWSHSVQEHKCISINGRCHDLSMYISTSSRFDVILISAHTTDHRKHQKI